MSDQEEAVQATTKDLVTGALEHYREVCEAGSASSSLIPQALQFWGEHHEHIGEIEQLHEYLLKKQMSYETKPPGGVQRGDFGAAIALIEKFVPVHETVWWMQLHTLVQRLSKKITGMRQHNKEVNAALVLRDLRIERLTTKKRIYEDQLRSYQKTGMEWVEKRDKFRASLQDVESYNQRLPSTFEDIVRLALEKFDRIFELEEE